MSVLGSYELALRIPRYLTMSALYKHHSSQDVIMRNGFSKQNANFEKSQELKGQTHEKVGEDSSLGSY
jgi:hypothetical protein